METQFFIFWFDRLFSSPHFNFLLSYLSLSLSISTKKKTNHGDPHNKPAAMETQISSHEGRQRGWWSPEGTNDGRRREGMKKEKERRWWSSEKVAGEDGGRWRRWSRRKSRRSGGDRLVTGYQRWWYTKWYVLKLQYIKWVFFEFSTHNSKRWQLGYIPRN